MQEIADQLQLPFSTMNNRYSRAFELITGYPYSPATWLRVFAIVKLLQNAVEIIGDVARRRPHRTWALRLVPDSQISAPSRDGTFVGTHARAQDNDQLRDLLTGLGMLFAKGLSNEEILDRFQVGREHEPAIEMFRQCLGENSTSEN